MKSLLSVLLLTLAFVATACSSTASAPSVPQEIVVIASDIAYDTGRIEASVGQPVELTLRNEGVLEHDFSIMHIPAEISEADEEQEDGHDMSAMEEMPELHVSAMPGMSNAISFTPAQASEYPYFCTVEGHQEAGMSGVLVVTAP